MTMVDPIDGAPSEADVFAAQMPFSSEAKQTSPSVTHPEAGGELEQATPARVFADSHPADGSSAASDSDAVAPAAAPATSSPRPALQGNIDHISDLEINGWVRVPDQPSHRCSVALKADGRVLARTTASRFRPDLLSSGIGDGCYSFAFEMPRLLLDGEEHLLDIVEQGSDTPLTSEPIRWRSAAGTGSDDLTRASEPAGGEFPGALALQPGAKARRSSFDARLSAGTMRRPAGQHGAGVQSSPQAGTTILFDISDLVYYIGHHSNLTGIQRVQSSIVLSTALGNLLEDSSVFYLSFNVKTGRWNSIQPGFLVSLLQDLFLPKQERLVTFSDKAARFGSLPGAIEFDGDGVLDNGNPSVICLLGAAWVQRDYFNRILSFKRRFGTRFVMTVHDLIPIYARETCDQGTVRIFETFLKQALRHVDHYLCVSENTAKDLRRHSKSLSMPEPRVTVTQNGSSFAEFQPATAEPGEIRPEDLPDRFVLFVSTIEGRKNHQLMLDVWRRMIDEGDAAPHLVCVGRLGWRSEGFVSQLVETDYLDGKVILLQEVSDADLRLLYSRCLFTVYPSLYEGWGLPVGEALAAGKICVCSDRTSLPEVAGKFGTYIDIDNTEESWKVIRGLIVDEAFREKQEASIRQDYEAITWRSVAEAVVSACKAAVQVEWLEPYPYPATPYSTEISFARLEREAESNAIGSELMTRIVDARRGYFLYDALRTMNFLCGEDARAEGEWGEPENWGTWLCNSGGEIVLGLAPNESAIYYVFLRLRVCGPISDQFFTLSANGEVVWKGSIGNKPKNVIARVRRRATSIGDWRLRLRVDIEISAEKRAEILAIDRRIPTAGFERLVVVPDNDLKTRVDILCCLQQ